MASSLEITDVAPNSSKAASAENAQISSLLLLPLELRIHIYSYMTLSPLTSDGQSHLGLFYSCHQIQQEMVNEYDPSKYLDKIRSLFFGSLTAIRARPRRSDLVSDSVGLIRNIRLPLHEHYIDLPDIVEALGALFRLYLDRVTIEFTHTKEDFDMSLKHLGDRIFGPKMKVGEINCKKIILRIAHSANAEEESSRSTALEINHTSGVTFTMTIVQDSNDRLVERIYDSPSRFRVPRQFED